MAFGLLHTQFQILHVAVLVTPPQISRQILVGL